MVAVLVVVEVDGAALVVAVVVAAPVVLLVSVDALVVDAAEVSVVVELVVEPQAAIAASAAAAAKLKIKRMGSPPPGKWDEEPSALNLSAALAQSDNFESVPKCLVKSAFSARASALDHVHGQSALACFLVLGRHIQAGLAHGLDHLIERDFAWFG